MPNCICCFFLFLSDCCVFVICILTDLLGCVLIVSDCLLCGAYFCGNAYFFFVFINKLSSFFVSLLFLL